MASLQNSILKKEIRKTSPFAKEILHIQDELISLLGFYGKSEDSVITITIKESTLKKYKAIAHSEKVMPAVRFIARYNRLQGKEDVKLKAKALLKSIEKAEKQGKIEYYKPEVAEVKKSLKEYINTNNVLKVEDVNLKGLGGLNGLNGNIIASTNFENVKFSSLGFNGKWLKLIGNPTHPFAMMTYAKPGQGKSTMNIDFAHYLASSQNKKVLFIADEEKLGYTLQEKLKRLKASHPNLYITATMPNDLSMFDFVFMDSINSMDLPPEYLKELRLKYPQTSFMYVFQATKDGNFKGGSEYSHDVDVVIEVENGIAYTEKSRFGGNGEIKVY